MTHMTAADQRTAPEPHPAAPGSTVQEPVGILAIGIALPDNRIDPWEELAPNAGLNPRLRPILGCYELPLALPEQSTSFFAVEAARRALDSSGLHPRDIDVVISNNAYADYTDWQMSGLIAHELAITDATTFDVFGGCNTAGVALQAAMDLLRADLEIDTVLVALGDRLGGGTWPQFIADGGCSVILRRGHDELVLLDSAHHCPPVPPLFEIPWGGVLEPFTPHTPMEHEWQRHLFDQDRWRTVYRPIFKELCAAPMLAVCDQQNIRPADLDMLLIAHQQRTFNAALTRYLGLPTDKTPLQYIETLGHVGGADVFIDLAWAIRDDLIAKGDLVGLLVMGMGEAFGFLVRY